MALMIPDFIHKDCRSNAERKLFDRFKTELSDNYIVLHSYGISRHHKKVSSEIDFIILSPRGILCIEVKGGRIDYDRGVWYFTDRFGEMYAKKESPFEQVRSNMFALRRSIFSRFGSDSVYTRIILGDSVFFTDVDFHIESPEWDLNRLIDNNVLNNNLEKIVESQFDYSEKEIRRLKNINHFAELSDLFRQKAVKTNIHHFFP
ncbi:nuclease-related domain-containing protein [Acidobacteriota bacterium]